MTSGPGTYTYDGYIYSSLAGSLKLVKKLPETDSKEGVGKEELTVEVRAPGEETIVPAIGDIVTCKVLSVNPR